MSGFEEVGYEDAGTALTGLVARPSGAPRAAVLVFPTIMNPTPAVESKALDLAENGYLAMIGDFYGKQPENFDHSRVCASEIRETPEQYRQRLRASLRALATLEGADSLPIFIIGFCMGGQAALELANHLGVKFREGFVKNRYIGRTFIMPGQAARKKSVRQKLNAIELEFRGKNVMLVDDSIVRGTTCKQIIQMAREAGAKNVYFCSAAPAVRFPNVYGIDMPSAHELIAHNRSTQDVADLIGADWLIYQDLPDLIEAVGGGKIKIENFDCAVFDGKYVTGDVDEAYLDKIEQARNDASKVKTQAVSAIIDLYNN